MTLGTFQNPNTRGRSAIAAALGIDETEIQSVQTDWLDRMQEGVLVSLHIKRWRATTRLTWADLGLVQSTNAANLDDDARRGKQTSRDLLVLGEKRLLPKRIMDELNSIENSARASRDARSFKGQWGYFMPAANYLRWLAEIESYRVRYYAVRDRIVADYPDMVREVLAEYRRDARAAYRRMNALTPENMTGTEYATEFGFVEMYTDRIRDAIPTPETIAASFDFAWSLSYIPLPSLLNESPAANEDREERSAVLAMRMDVARQAQAQKQEMIDGFLRDVVAQMRGTAYNAVTDVLASMQKNRGKLVGKSAGQLRRLLAEIKNLDFYGDAELDKAFEKIRGIMSSSDVKTRNVSEIQAQLEAIATITRSSLLDLGEEPRSARDLGVADNPTPGLVRDARRELGFLEINPEESVVQVADPRPARVPTPVRDLDIVSSGPVVSVRRAGRDL